MAAAAAAPGTIPCCLCGQSIVPNDANTCMQCLKDRVDVTTGISRSEILYQCQSCARWRAEEGRWLQCEPESAELMALCLKAVHGLGRGKGKGKSGASFVDANWVWTEPHSRRLKLRIAVEKPVLDMNNATVRQRFDVEFIQKSRMCTFCVKETTDQQWSTVVQVRQQVPHKRTLLQLENRLLRGGAAKPALDVIPVPSGLDFYFAGKPTANKFADFVMASVPCRRKDSKKLQGTDVRNNTYTFRHSVAIEVVPICKHDVFVLPRKHQQALFGGAAAVVLCKSVTRTVNLVDPATGVEARLTEGKFWPTPFRAAAAARELVEFAVLDVRPLEYGAAEAEGDDAKRPAEVEVARQRDLGVNDERFTVVSHLGSLLQAGDAVLGYDFTHHNLGEEVLTPLKGKELPEIVLVLKKQDEDARRDRRRRRAQEMRRRKRLTHKERVVAREDEAEDHAVAAEEAEGEHAQVAAAGAEGNEDAEDLEDDDDDDLDSIGDEVDEGDDIEQDVVN